MTDGKCFQEAQQCGMNLGNMFFFGASLSHLHTLPPELSSRTTTKQEGIYKALNILR